tara:strand:+ start:46 stop:450 length:405 start_codon:yes stop_codon:yes gene_type:complete
MAGVNKVILIGNLGKDPDVRTTQNGLQVAKFSLATSEKYKGQEKTQWHNITCFGNQAETAQKYLKKGSKVFVDGKLDYQQYEHEGQTKYRTEIVCFNFQMLSGEEERGEVLTSLKPPQKQPQEELIEETDDIPF